MTHEDALKIIELLQSLDAGQDVIRVCLGALLGITFVSFLLERR